MERKVRKFISVLLMMVLIYPYDVAFSQRRNASGRNAKKSRKTKSTTRNNAKSNKNFDEKAKNSTVSQEISEQKANEEGGGTKLTCEEKYDLCMDNVCLNETGLRYLCDTSTDSMETVDRDGEKFRVGNDLYTFAKGECVQTLKTCALAERNRIQTNYMAQIKNDLLTKNYTDAMNAASDETQEDLFLEYSACMQPLCGTMFSDCFTITKIERRTPNCDGILKKSARPLSVKKMFYEEIEKQRKALCSKQGGYIDYDTKVCKITVDYGKPEVIQSEDGQYLATGKMKKKVTSKTFNVGEMVECTQEFFETVSVDRPFLKDAIKDFAMGAVRSVAGVALVVVGAVGTVASLGTASANTVSMMSNGGALICKGAANTLNGAVKLNTTVKEGGCFINGKFIAPMNSYFKVTFWN